MFVARPVAVFATLALTRLNMREKTMVAWVGLRGAVPIILATFPLLAEVPQATTTFHLVFFIVLTSVLLQGTSIPIVARWLDVDEPLAPRKESSPVWDAPTSLKSGLLEVRIPEHSWSIGQRLLDLGLPKGAFILLIARNGKCFVPDGTAVLQADDSLLAFTDQFSFLRLRSILESRHPPPPSEELPDDRGVEVV
jgi:cell volume regulation protein A